MKPIFLTGVIGALLAAPVAAQDYPNLVGTWTGKSRAVVTASGGHYDGQGDGAKFVSADLTLVWAQQDDGRLIGTLKSGAHEEVKVGVIARAGDMFVTADSDGTSIGRIMDPNSFELCYTQASEGGSQATASCVVFTRSGG